jgi:hypothetical protein
VNCAAYVLSWMCELYVFGCRQFPELLRPEPSVPLSKKMSTYIIK